MFRILLIGNTGQLGWELERLLSPLGEVLAVDYPEINLANEKNIRQSLQGWGRFHVIINAAAYTDVDRAEKEIILAMSVNGNAPRVLAEEAQKMGAALIHYSTDYVFDGSKGSPYLETDTPNPLNVYGVSKLAGEHAVKQVGGSFLVLRTAWVYSLRRDSFVTKVLRWAREQPVMRIVTDQVSNPSWARSLADATARVLYECQDDAIGWLSERKGIYHLAGEGYVSRFEWAKEILSLDQNAGEHRVQELLPAITADFQTSAKRPRFSALDCGKFERVFNFRLVHWKDALQQALFSP